MPHLMRFRISLLNTNPADIERSERERQMKTYKTIVSIGISDMTVQERKVFADTLFALNWHKVEGLAETWELSVAECENKDDARFTIMNDVMQAKIESRYLGAIKILIAFDSGRPTHITLSE